MDNLKALYEELQKHLLEDDKPSIHLNNKLQEGIINSTYPFNMLSDLIKIEQSATHHPEGNVWNHTLMVVDEAAKRKDMSKDPRIFMWAALLHDLGKAPTTRLRKGRITSYDHDKVGKELSVEFLKSFTDESTFINEVAALVRWHMQVLFVVRELPFADIKNMLSEVDIEEIALLSLCDRLGRGNMTKEKISAEKKNIEDFTRKCKDYLIKI